MLEYTQQFTCKHTYLHTYIHTYLQIDTSFSWQMTGNKQWAKEYAITAYPYIDLFIL